MPNPSEETQARPQIEQLKADLRKAQQEGQLRTERIREIVRTAVSQAATELQQGSSEIRLIAKEAFAAVIDSLKGRGQETRDELTASIEGIIEGISQSRRKAITQSQTELNQLQTQIEAQENQLNTEIEDTLGEINKTGENTSSDIREAVQAAISTLQESEEAALLRKRYAQLQAQLAIVKANLAARYGEQYDEMQQHLEDAKTWHRNAQASSTEPNTVERKQAEFERKIGEAGTAIARKEKQVKQLLKELLHSITDLARDDKNSR